jgi:hypothetical protein
MVVATGFVECDGDFEEIDCMDGLQFNRIVPRRSFMDKVGSAFDLY